MSTARHHATYHREDRTCFRDPFGRPDQEGTRPMAELALKVGFGLAARGDVSDVLAWAEEARGRGIDSIWVHDSYFERDAVTYGSALAANVDGIRIGLGALNPFTRHPVVLAMTVSALDEMAPGRVMLGLGTGLPLRLAQMGIPYTPDEGVTRVSKTIDDLRALWSGERLPPGQEGVPPLQPMFPPVHHVPIYIAGYRSPMAELAGQKAEGYLARPAESVRGVNRLVTKVRRASVNAGRAGERGPRRRISTDLHRRHAARRPQPSETRAVRDLHDEHPVRPHPARRRVRQPVARRHPRGLEGRGLPPRCRDDSRQAARYLDPVWNGRRSRGARTPTARPA